MEYKAQKTPVFKKLTLYPAAEGSILRDMMICHCAWKEGSATEDTVELFCQTCSRLIALAETFGFNGNIWQSYLTYELLTNENPFSLACEGRGNPGGTLSKLAKLDLEYFLRLIQLKFSPFDSAPRADTLYYLFHYETRPSEKNPVGALVDGLRDGLVSLSPEDADTALGLIAAFYRDHGVGKLAFHRAFHIDQAAQLVPIRGIAPTSLDELVGYEIQKEQLTANTEAFLAGKPANNVLLYGDAGTGKSTCVRSLLTDYRRGNLRIVELTKPQLEQLEVLISTLRERNYRFIIFIDDLSFEEHETGYKHLKAVIEGGLETMPDNVRIYATSNRRHLIKETWKDKADMEHDGDIHRSDTVEEKLSLAARFGVAINFPSPVRKQYHEIVRTLAARQLPFPVEEELLLRGADRWEIRHGGITGRTAQQYIDYLAGREALNDSQKNGVTRLAAHP